MNREPLTDAEIDMWYHNAQVLGGPHSDISRLLAEVRASRARAPSVGDGLREALILLIASFPAHEENLGPDNTVFADHIPYDGADIGDCPKPIERLADAILATFPAMLSAAPSTPGQGWEPTHRHADGGLYRLIGPVAVRVGGEWDHLWALYDGADGIVRATDNTRWCQRFEPLPPQSQASQTGEEG